MSTLVYSPGIKVTIHTQKAGIVDVSDDLTRGTLTLNEAAPHSFSFGLANHRRKYDRLFMPDDRIFVRLKRISWLPILAGYLDQVPFFSVYPRTVGLTATCTLKRLQYRYWDAGAQASYDLLHGSGESFANVTEVDGGLKGKAIRLINQVAGWPLANIHVGEVPHDWFEKVSDLYEKSAEVISINSDMLGAAPSMAGGTGQVTGGVTVAGGGPGTGALPATEGKVSYFAGPGNTDATGNMALTGEPGRDPRDKWYCAMRWAYLTDQMKTWLTPAETKAARAWWTDRKILVTNPKNGRQVVLRAADWGPNIKTGKSLDMSRHSLETVLAGATNDVMHFAFAPEDAPLGPVQARTAAAPGALGPMGTGIQTPPITVEAASGIRFTSADSLRGNVAAARQFIKTNWSVPEGIGGYANRNISGTNTPSDHAKGLALDVMVSEGEPNAEQIALGNSVALWFTANPQAFGVKYVIWYNRINTGDKRGWRQYRSGAAESAVQGHRNHVHISFQDTNQTALGPFGNGFVGSTPENFQGGFTTSGPPSSGGDLPLFNAIDWFGASDPESEVLGGPRALMNDEPILPVIGALLGASMRTFCSAPNGDFISWFPDYFGIYGSAARMVVEDIELLDFTIHWSDARLITHQFTSGASTGFSTGGPGGGDAASIYQKVMTHGIVSVENRDVMRALLNLDDDHDPYGFLDSAAVLDRFGARPNYQPMPMISDHRAEFWYALFLFQKNWAEQFVAQIPLTFMPELFPGMLLVLAAHGLQVYVESVTHSFDFGAGGGFSTSVVIKAPAATDGSGLRGLPRAGSEEAAEEGGGLRGVAGGRGGAKGPAEGSGGLKG